MVPVPHDLEDAVELRGEPVPGPAIPLQLVAAPEELARLVHGSPVGPDGRHGTQELPLAIEGNGAQAVARHAAAADLARIHPGALQEAARALDHRAPPVLRSLLVPPAARVGGVVRDERRREATPVAVVEGGLVAAGAQVPGDDPFHGHLRAPSLSRGPLLLRPAARGARTLRRRGAKRGEAPARRAMHRSVLDPRRNAVSRYVASQPPRNCELPVEAHQKGRVTSGRSVLC